MSDLHLKAPSGVSNGKFHVGLSLIEFVEDDVNIVYSPALDLSGYGKTEDEAKSSFAIVIEEFFRYTIDKNTFDKVLKDLGWSIKGSKENLKFSPPKDSDLVNSNALYSDIVNNKNYKVSREKVEFSL
ncbi:hypothetical protein [Pedobacter sp. UYP30]|uniref:hypothetical protein n=1 Tax=Pedobacter sp. UYP30 TaxID=1756400 RepID=UPI003393002F